MFRHSFRVNISIWFRSSCLTLDERAVNGTQMAAGGQQTAFYHKTMLGYILKESPLYGLKMPFYKSIVLY